MMSLAPLCFIWRECTTADVLSQENSQDLLSEIFQISTVVFCLGGGQRDGHLSLVLFGVLAEEIVLFHVDGMFNEH